MKKPFATFNNYPHQNIEVPDGGFTASFQTSEGKRITVAFVPYKEGGPPQCVDISYHDGGQTISNGRHECPVMEVVGFTVGRNTFDTRDIVRKGGQPTSLATVLIGDVHYQEQQTKSTTVTGTVIGPGHLIKKD